MTTAHAIKTALAFAHLLLVICGAGRCFPAPAGSLPRQAYTVYGEYSGASNSYGFFAPSVASQWQALFSIYGDDGPGWTDEARWPVNHEVHLRVGTVLSFFQEKEMRPGLAACWAAHMFGRHPRALLINVHVIRHDLPSMEEYRGGERPMWTTVAVFPFSYDPEGNEEE